jgi:hypothetical protein
MNPMILDTIGDESRMDVVAVQRLPHPILARFDVA